LVFDVTGRIENITFSEYTSNDGSSFFFLYLKETFYCNNIQINNSAKQHLDGKIVYIWKAKVSMSNFQLNNMSIFRLFDVQMYSRFDISNLLVKNINCSNEEGGSLFYISSYTKVFAYNLTIANISSDIDTIAVYDAFLNITSASLNRIFLYGDHTEFFLFLIQSAEIIMENMFIEKFYRSLLLGFYSTNCTFTNISVNNERNLLDTKLYYSYSMFEFNRIDTVFFTNCKFGNSNYALRGGVTAYL